MAETNIIYKYRAPGASPDDDDTITAERVDLHPAELVATYHAVGESVTLQADDSTEYGEDPREYVVLQRNPVLTQSGDAGFSLSFLAIIVTDPDA